jgi:transposase
MDRAYEGDDTRQLALDLGYIPVVPPKADRLCPWEYDRVMYRRRNEVERLFRRLKGFCRVFSRFDKLDVMFAAFVLFALIVEALRVSVSRPQPGIADSCSSRIARLCRTFLSDAPCA